MSSILFDKNIEPCCIYCRHGTDIGCDEVACVKHGIMNAAGSCRRFFYEPTKRIPEIGIRFDANRFNEEDFAL